MFLSRLRNLSIVSTAPSSEHRASGVLFTQYNVLRTRAQPQGSTCTGNRRPHITAEPDITRLLFVRMEALKLSGRAPISMTAVLLWTTSQPPDLNCWTRWIGRLRDAANIGLARHQKRI